MIFLIILFWAEDIATIYEGRIFVIIFDYYCKQ